MSVLRSLCIKQGDLSRAVSSGNTALTAFALELGIRASQVLQDCSKLGDDPPDFVGMGDEVEQSLRAIQIEAGHVLAAHRSQNPAMLEAAALRIYELLTTAENSWSKPA